MAGFRDFQTGEVLTSANVNDFLAKQAVMKFADAAARDTALGTAVGGSNALREGMVAYLDDTDDLQVYNGTAWSGVGYRYAGTRYYTSSGSFAKADPLGTGDIGLRAIRVRMVGGGGSGGGTAAVTSGQSAEAAGGSGGGYAEKFITNIAGLSASETVTRGTGGAAAAAGGNGNTGGTSSAFGVTATGGSGGLAGSAFSSTGQTYPPTPGSGSSGDINIDGMTGGGGLVVSGGSTVGANNHGGASFFSGSVNVNGSGTDGSAGSNYGGGASGARSRTSNAARPSAAGANGIVIIDCFV